MNTIGTLVLDTSTVALPDRIAEPDQWRDKVSERRCL